MIKNLLLPIAKELYLEETGLYVSSESEAEWESVKRQFPQKFSLALCRAKAYINDYKNQLIEESNQADLRSLARQFFIAEAREEILPEESTSGVYGLNDADLNLLYIGETECIFTRVKQHRREGKIAFKTVQYVEVLDNEFLRKRLQEHLIYNYDPPVNQQGRRAN